MIFAELPERNRIATEQLFKGIGRAVETHLGSLPEQLADGIEMPGSSHSIFDADEAKALLPKLFPPKQPMKA